MLNVVVYKVRQKSDVPRGLGFCPFGEERGRRLPELLEAFNALPPQATVIIAREFWGFGRIVAIAFQQSSWADDWMLSLHDVHTSLAERNAQTRVMFRMLDIALDS
jgi:hypothetical protein